MSQGEFMNKSPQVAFDYFDFLAESANFGTTLTLKQSSRTHLRGTGGRYNISKDDKLEMKISNLTRKMEAIETRATNNVSQVVCTTEQVGGSNTMHQFVEHLCAICHMSGHSTENCPSIPAYTEVLHEQTNAVMGGYKKPYNVPLPNAYNPGLRDHPNFGWRNDHNVLNQSYQAPYQQQQQHFSNIQNS